MAIAESASEKKVCFYIDPQGGSQIPCGIIHHFKTDTIECSSHFSMTSMLYEGEVDRRPSFTNLLLGRRVLKRRVKIDVLHEAAEIYFSQILMKS